MRYIRSESTDPYWNLALEQYVFDRLDRNEEYFMLWQNDNAIIIGKNQNTAGEINADYVKEHEIKVVRRLSGGGAVYHDLGNINFTFITDSNSPKFDFSTFCEPVIRALETLGVSARLSGRNDMTIDGKKFSGNSMYMKEGRVMHHGTIMYDSNLQVLSRALCVTSDKIESKGIKSVVSRVTNIKPHMNKDLHIEHFIEALREFMEQTYRLQEYQLTQKDLNEIQELSDEVYRKWEWNYGKSPQYSILKVRRIEGCGKIELWMDVKQERIEDLVIKGDFFGNGDLQELVDCLKGCRLVESDIVSALKGKSIRDYIHNLTLPEFISLLIRE